MSTCGYLLSFHHAFNHHDQHQHRKPPHHNGVYVPISSGVRCTVPFCRLSLSKLPIRCTTVCSSPSSVWPSRCSVKISFRGWLGSGRARNKKKEGKKYRGKTQKRWLKQLTSHKNSWSHKVIAIFVPICWFVTLLFRIFVGCETSKTRRRSGSHHDSGRRSGAPWTSQPLSLAPGVPVRVELGTGP